MIYFDNAATTAVSDNVISVIEKTMRDDFGNPSSKHILGVNAESYVKAAAATIAATLKVKSKEIVFTSGGTESNNMAIIGGAMANQRAGKHLITTAIEHPAVYMPMEYLESQGYEMTVLPVDSEGHISLDDLRKALRPDTVLVSTMIVNNEIGAIEPVEEIGRIIKEFNPKILYHVDAIQGYGKLKIQPKKMNIDLLSVSAHKIHGPKGVGFLYIDEKAKIKPIVFGGGQQGGMRSGTINVPGIAGLGTAAHDAYASFTARVNHMREVKDFIIEGAGKIDGVTVNSAMGEAGAPHIVSISMKNVRAEVMLHALEAEEIYVSSGSACSSHHPGISGTLKAIGLKEELLDSTIRVSLCEDNTIEEAEIFLSVLKENCEKLRKFTRK